MSAAARDEVLRSINAIRALHNLPAVSYAAADEPEAMASSLIMTANRQITHTPSPDMRCYSDLGSRGAGSSDIYGGAASSVALFQPNDSIIAGWLIETDNLIANNVGHRRWILDPFLTTIAYGRVAVEDNGGLFDSAALKVFDFSAGSAIPANLPEFVAYPFGDYPARYFDSRALLSFGVISDPRNKFNNTNVDYSRATVSVRQRDGASLAVSNISSDTVGYGLPNNIQFNVAGLAANTFYDVTIANVLVGGVARTYNYSFRILG